MNYKRLWFGLGLLFTTSLTTTGIILFSKKPETKKPKSEIDFIYDIQKLYQLKSKKNDGKINDAEKQIYKSANVLGSLIFNKRKNYKIIVKKDREKNTNLEQILLIMTTKNKTRNLDIKKHWPWNKIDKKYDHFVVLITFLKKKVIQVKKLVKFDNRDISDIFDDISIYSKKYDMTQLFYKFKNNNLKANNFEYYNAYFDDKNGSKGLVIFKNYLSSLTNNILIKRDIQKLKGIKFIKKNININKKTITVKLTFEYEGLLADKEIDFIYKEAYKLKLEAGAEDKMADEVKIKDITNLPTDVTINRIEPSSDFNDGTTIKIIFDSGKIKEQELTGFSSYKSKAQKLLSKSLIRELSGFYNKLENLFPNKKNILPSKSLVKKSLIKDVLTEEANKIQNANAKEKVKDVLGDAKIIFEPDDKIGHLVIEVYIDEKYYSYTIGGFKNN